METNFEKENIMTELNPILNVGNINKTYCKAQKNSDYTCKFLYDLINGGYACRLFFHHFSYNNFNPKRIKKCRDCELADVSNLLNRLEQK